MKIVNINDIEDLILAKHEIDLYRIENKEISERSNLNDFINTYVSPKYIYLIDNKQLPFCLIDINNTKYLFVTEYTNLNVNIIHKLKRLNYDLNFFDFDLNHKVCYKFRFYYLCKNFDIY